VRILVVNAGSTSFKYQLLDMTDESVLARGRIERIGSANAPVEHEAACRTRVHMEADLPDHGAAIGHAIRLLTEGDDACFASLGDLSAVAFKTVHAGRITGSVRIDERVLQAMREAIPHAPAHNPPFIRAIEIFRELCPGMPLVGVFEPHFHVSLPPRAYVGSYPYEWQQRYGIRKLGFHGASHHYIAERVPQIVGRPAKTLKIISCHLGGSSSLCAIDRGVSVDTSMDFSAQAGVPMGTRCGDTDVFAVLYVMDREGLTTDDMRRILTNDSGLAGISGIGADVRDLEEAAARGHQRAQLALDVFAYQVKRYIGAYIAAMNGCDVLVFTGGIGERGAKMRARICADMDWLGISLDPVRNDACVGTEARISRDDTPVRVMVVPTNEELVVAREAAKVLQG
jgi:acetate kinase